MNQALPLQETNISQGVCVSERRQKVMWKGDARKFEWISIFDESSKMVIPKDNFALEMTQLWKKQHFLATPTLPETKSSPLNMCHPKRNFIFQPLISRSYISFRRVLQHRWKNTSKIWKSSGKIVRKNEPLFTDWLGSIYSRGGGFIFTVLSFNARPLTLPCIAPRHLLVVNGEKAW